MFKKLAPVGLVLIFAAMACSFAQELAETEPEESGETVQTVVAPADEAVEMTCEDMGLPCTLEEAEAPALARTAELHQELKGRLAAGESLADAGDWLEAQEEVRLVLRNPYGLVFILNGGLPSGVYDAVEATGAAAAASPNPIAVKSDPRPAEEVVGNDTGRENESRHKRALVLSPFAFEFNIPDVGSDAAQILSGIPDYRGRVEYLENEAVGVSAFQGWERYDVILYNGHGGIFSGRDKETGEAVQSTFIVTGDEQTSCDLQTTLQDFGLSGEYPAGIGCIGVKVRVENIVGRADDVFKDYLMVSPIFFVTQYPSGLEKAVILFNGCVTFVSDILPSRLAGQDSVFFGWDDNVLAGFNPGVISGLLTEMARGLPSEDAYDEICEGGACVDSSGVSAELQRLGPGEDLRIREIATSLHPLTEDALGDADKVPVYGYPGDGQVDEIPFLIEVIGVKFEQIADYTVRFEVNGQEVQGTWKLDDPDQVERWESPRLDTYRIGDRMLLPFDFQQDMPLNVVVVVELPEGGESRSVKVEALARNPVLALQSTFESEEEGAVLRSTVSAEVPLSLVEIKEEEILFESLGQEEQLKYEAFEAEIPGLDCTVTGNVQNGDLPVQEAVFRLEDATNTAFGPPERVVLYPSGEITEWYETSCQGIQISTPPLSFWYANFAVASEDLFTDEGLVYTAWETGDGELYARFHRELDRPPASGEYTFTIREP